MILYGAAGTRASRALWALEELGIAYTHEPTWPVTESHRPAFLKLNPNGRVPVLDDDGFVLWEAGAINCYLAEKYGGEHWAPREPEGRAELYRWTLWAQAEFEWPMISIALARDEAERTRAEAAMHRPLRVLEGVLAARGHILGPAFSMADLNVAGMLQHCHEQTIGGFDAFDLSAVPRVAAWLKAAITRPASQRVAAMARSDPRAQSA